MLLNHKSYYVCFLFSCCFGETTWLRMVFKMKLKIVLQGLSLVLKVWRNWMDAHHIVGVELMSLWWENRAKLWMSWLVNLNKLLSLYCPIPICAEDISQPSWGRAFSWSVALSPWGLKVTALKKGACVVSPWDPPRVYSPLGRPQNRVWREAGSNYLIHCKNFD